MLNSITIEFELCANKIFDEMIAEHLITANIYKNKVKIDTLVCEMFDVAETFAQNMNDTEAYHFLAKRRAEKRKHLI